MGQAQRSLHFEFFFLTLTLFLISTPTSLVYSLRPPKQPKQYFQILDVSATIHKALQVFSNEKAQPTALTKFSALSLPLIPVESIIKPNDQNYSALTLSRLASDSARVKFLNSKLQLVFSKSGYKTDVQTEGLEHEAPITSVAGRHFVRVGVGQPVKKFYLLFDTGSDVNWLQCLPCEQCYEQYDPIFDPSQSFSYSPLPCASQQCTSLNEQTCSDVNTCIYGVVYGDRSSSIGEFATETVSYGNSGSFDNVAIGCGHVNQGFKGMAGIIGLGGGALGFPSQIKSTSFSYCLVDTDSSSSSTLDFNSASPGDSVLVPLVVLNTFYYVELTGITIGGEQVSIPASVYQVGIDGSGGIIVDSGTTVSRFPTQVYNLLRDTFVKHSENLHLTNGFSIFDTCFDIPPNINVSVPTMSFEFSSSKTVPLRMENYLVPVDANGKFCLAFAPPPPTLSDISIIGSTQQKRMRVTYDLEKKEIGFSPNKC